MSLNEYFRINKARFLEEHPDCPIILYFDKNRHIQVLFGERGEEAMNFLTHSEEAIPDLEEAKECFLETLTRTPRRNYSRPVHVLTRSIPDDPSQPDWNSPKNLIIEDSEGFAVPVIPTTIADENGTVLGLAYSSRESLAEAIRTRKGVYYSRSRKEVWTKSPSGKNGQVLIDAFMDCDRDALLFRVRQRGNFCHENRLSCFNTRIAPPLPIPKVKIGLVAGRSEESCLELLNGLGIHVYKKQLPRVSQFLVKTHLGENVDIVSLKPRDVKEFLSNGLVDMVVGFSDSIDSHEGFQFLFPPASSALSKAVRIVASGPTETPDFGIVLTEYPEATKRWLNRIDKTARIHPCHGNVEQLVAGGTGTMAVAIADTGRTLERNSLFIYDTLEEHHLGCFWSNDSYSKFPRFFREVQNNLQQDIIFFYSVDGPNGFMSNFYLCLADMGTQWKSSEHYYQAHKFPRDAEVEHNGKLVNLRWLIASQPTAKQCYKMSWLYAKLYRQDWFASVVPCERLPDIPGLLVKDKVMWKALCLKFAPSSSLKQKLLATGKRELVEHALRDPHYGCGIDGTGKNMLGKMLMYGRDFGFTLFDQKV